MTKLILGLACALSLSFPLVAQQDDDVLFTVDGAPVTVGEFRYIYSKTNSGEADFSRASVMEYLDLYERFKLKVARANEMGLDTVTALQNELEGYRRQLANNYLVDREVTDKLVEDLYARQQRDVEFSHILLTLPSGDPADTLAVYRRARELRDEVTAENFAEQARTYSEDAYSKDRGGRIGYVSAPLPRGMYRLEEALYGAEDGAVVGPVRTPAGYHIALRHGSRPAYGEVEIAHILIRKGDNVETAAARARAEAARQALTDGASFEDVAAEYSEDDETRQQGGYIGFFGINRYNKDFERAAFALERDGAISDVIESPVGFHVLKRISRRGMQPLEQQRPLLEAAVRNDVRYADAQRALLQRLAKEYGTKKMQANYADFVAGLDSTFFLLDTDLAPAGDDKVLLQVGDRELRASDFANYLTRNARLRASLERRYEADGAADLLFESWTDEQVQAYAEAQLEKQFPEFRALMREYREGILLFEATKLEVWDKAGEDSTGLQAFFDAHRDDYRFGPQAHVLTFTVTGDGPAPAEVLSYARTHDPEATADHFAGTGVAVGEERYEEDRLPDGLTMEAGSATAPTVTAGSTTFQLVADVEPARRKELAEARGYVIADYQDQLEREWVEALRRKFAVKRNQKVLAKLIES
ncbi:peptidylprolyl isomerase [Lewinella sp. IMCC34183]|uniref:foldase protein PrsA n=1 Tax=Lewinella sp. IMCC34183 TaxID=2248762 RepID=UPI0018E528F4|nr:peptidylprolyl isomerase [Lewinella sp. IMCC34183]